MTISDQLHFSVLIAPVATLDRRALSQAWYSALYAAQSACAPAALAKPVPAMRVPSTCAKGAGTHARCAHATFGVRGRSARSPLGSALPPERRAERSKLARRIERAFLRQAARPASAAFTLAGRSRVRVILRSDGSGMHLVAICSKRAERAVAEALAQARYALALRGVALSCRALADQGR